MQTPDKTNKTRQAQERHSSSSPTDNTLPKVIDDCHELLKWLIPLLDQFPRARRFTLGEPASGSDRDARANSAERNSRLRRVAGAKVLVIRWFETKPLFVDTSKVANNFPRSFIRCERVIEHHYLVTKTKRPPLFSKNFSYPVSVF